MNKLSCLKYLTVALVCSIFVTGGPVSAGSVSDLSVNQLDSILTATDISLLAKGDPACTSTPKKYGSCADTVGGTCTAGSANKNCCGGNSNTVRCLACVNNKWTMLSGGSCDTQARVAIKVGVDALELK